MTDDDITNVATINFHSTGSSGIRFWESTSYQIYMAPYGQSGAGRLVGDSDYNMYFRMTGGTNRGFAFQSSTGTPFFHVTPSDVYCSATLRVRDAHSLMIYSAGNDKYFQIYNNDVDGYITCNSGDIRIQSNTYLYSVASSNVHYYNWTHIIPNTNKLYEIGFNGEAWGDVNADNFYNRGPEYIEKTDESCLEFIRDMKLEKHPTEVNGIKKAEFNCEHFPDEVMGIEREEKKFQQQFVDPMMAVSNELARWIEGEEQTREFYEELCTNMKRKELHRDASKNGLIMFHENPKKWTKHEHGMSINQMQMYLMKALRASITRGEVLENRIKSMEKDIEKLQK